MISTRATFVLLLGLMALGVDAAATSTWEQSAADGSTGQAQAPPNQGEAGASMTDTSSSATPVRRRIDPVSDDATFSLLTILPGDQIYSLWGHSAIRVHDPVRGMDSSFNYGTFRFDRYFLPNFLYGRLDYMLSVHYYEAALDDYRMQGRPVIEQVLHLTPAQKDSLYHFLAVNARPENRVYRYHFLYDNCSTRIRDALEHSLGTAVHFASEPDPGLTFRSLLDDGIAETTFLDAGIDWLLGSPVDRVAQPYETMFLPEYLMRAFDTASIDNGGSLVPLVARTDTVLWIPGYGDTATAFPWATLVMWMIFLAGVVLTVRGVRQGSGVIRSFDVPLFAIVGIAGVLIVFLWFISLHDVTENNWHLLWAWPTHVGAAVALMRRRPHLWLRRYLFMSAVLALAAAAGSFLWDQWFHPALYPLMLLVAVRGMWIFIAANRHEQKAAAAAS